MCKDHLKKEKTCETCLSETIAEQSVVLERLWERLETLWGRHPELHDEIKELQQQHPVTGIEVLAIVPFSMEEEIVLGVYSRIRGGVKNALLGANGNGYFIYHQVAKT